MARWMLLLSEFSFEFKLIRTNENFEADSLSRMFCNANIAISDKSSPFTEKNLLSKFSVTKDSISNQLIAIPSEKINTFIVESHRYLRHPGIEKLYQTLRRTYQFPLMKDHITRVLKDCQDCNRCKSHQIKYGLVHGSLEATDFNDLVCLDLAGPYEAVTFNHPNLHTFHLLVITDIATRYSVVTVLDNLRSKTC